MVLPIQWQLNEFGGSRGTLGPKIQIPGLLVPVEVWMEEGRLCWTMYDTRQALCVEPPDGLLQRFVSLRGANDHRICGFASQFGLIQPYATSPDKGSVRRGSEFTEQWRTLAKRAFALIDLACVATGEHEKIQANDLDAISVDADTIPDGYDPDEKFHETGWQFNRLVPTGGSSLPLSLYSRPEHDPTLNPSQMRAQLQSWIKDVVSFEVSEWLRLGRVGWRLVSTDEGWRLQVGFDGCLLGALAIQLATEISKASDIYQCSTCGKLYPRHMGRRRPNPGCKNYCPECVNRREPQREADRRRRARAASARRMASAGKTIDFTVE